jgi:hypothetical protein
MIFCLDSDLARIRSSVMRFLPTGQTGWGEFRSEAAGDVIRDLEDYWYAGAADLRSVLILDNPFDVSRLLCGWNFESDNTAAVAIGEIVRVVSGHESGGTVGGYYRKILTDLTETDLTETDFSEDTEWEAVTDRADDLSALSCYRSLFLIYRFLAGDMPDSGDAFERQRDYFLAQYEKELARVLGRGLPYDWGDLPNVSEAVKIRKTTVIW